MKLKNSQILYGFFILMIVLVSIVIYNQFLLLDKLGAPRDSESFMRLQQADFISIEKSMPIVAVSKDNEGVVGNLQLKLIPGENNVLVSTSPFLETDLQYSLNTAAYVAVSRSAINFESDFIYTYDVGKTQLIGGGSAGAAAAVATYAALNGLEFRDDVILTGTISSDGTIGKVGGILEKAEAAAGEGFDIFLVPKGQSMFTYYEVEYTREPYRRGISILSKRYVPHTVDLAELALEEWGLEIIEVGTFEEASAYFFEI